MASRINVGWLAMAAAWLIGVYVAGLRPDVVLAGFPVPLFLTLVGVTLLFAIAEANGTLEALAHRVVGLARGQRRLMPGLVFVLACALSSIGPGSISTVALVAPLAMAMGGRLGVTPLLTALMVANGANAGNLSPFSSVGVIANGAMARAGLTGHEGKVWFANFAAHLIVGSRGLRVADPAGRDRRRPHGGRSDRHDPRTHRASARHAGASWAPGSRASSPSTSTSGCRHLPPRPSSWSQERPTRPTPSDACPGASS